jgi:hypothetical protein
MKVEIEDRYGATGFAYAGDTRMVFAPRFFVTRREEDRESSDIVLCAARNWMEPTKAQLGAIIDAMAKSYPGRRLFADTDRGLIQVSGPTEGRPLCPIGYEAYYEYAGFKYQVKKTEDGWIATAHPGQHRAATKIKHLQAAVQCYLRGFKEA